MNFAETDSPREPDIDQPSGDPIVDEETELAAEEAARIGGDPGNAYPDQDPAQIPVEEGGGGEAEGFELAEEALIDEAEHGDSGVNPLGHEGRAEEPLSAEATYGESDHVVSQDEVEDENEAVNPEDSD
ncbi:hypothetical protein HJD18_03055 [Thermoleophilia bacterium SCSIO 60948]|nr:hypothetical protein HJD18_03055 [Thermoleophilia bacterium SCSIO 60948]